MPVDGLSQTPGYQASYAMLDMLDVIAVAVDPAGVMLFANRRFERAVKAKRGLITGNITDHLPGAAQLLEHPSVKRALALGSAVTIEGVSKFMVMPEKLGLADSAVVVPARSGSGGGRALIIQFVVSESLPAPDSRAQLLQDVILRVSESTHHCDTLPQLCASIHEALSSLIDTTNLYVALYDEDSRLYHFPYDVDTVDQQEFCTEPQLLENSLTDYVRRTGTPMLVDRETQQRLIDEREIEVYGEQCQMWLGAPLRLRNGVIGVVAVQSYGAENVYTPSDLQLLTFVSQYIAMAVERTRTMAALRESQERAVLVANGANDGLWDWNLPSGEVYYSPRFMAMLGWDGHVSPSVDTWFSKVHHDDLAQLRADVEAHLTGAAPHFENEHRLLHRDATWRWVLVRGLSARHDDGQPYRMAGSLMDITARKRSEARLLYEAMHDQLTGLPNRTVLMDRLEHCLDRAKRNPSYRFAVLLLDLDRFKVINDSLGHLIGDDLLIAISRRLKSCIRPTDTVARLGGDEFTVLLEEISGPQGAVRVASRIQEACSRRFNLGGHEVFTNASIGIALGAHDYERPDDVLRDADTAMYRAKSLGKARHEIFDDEMRNEALRVHEIENDLRPALERDELRVFYQPIISLKTGLLSGFEALVRWQHPTRGLVSPADFVPIAEETGMIVPIGRFVLEEACRQLADWHRDPAFRDITCKVNVSGRQFGQTDLVEEVSRALRAHDLSPSHLCLEITESAVIRNGEAATATLRALRRYGVRLSMDDFGTGYSSLSYLHQLPIHSLKVDRSFVSRIEDDPDQFEIVQTILSMATSLNLLVVAEGVETEGGLKIMKDMNCDFAQGYLFAKPLPADDATEFMRLNRQW